jgi:hypothetical protein
MYQDCEYACMSDKVEQLGLVANAYGDGIAVGSAVPRKQLMPVHNEWCTFQLPCSRILVHRRIEAALNTRVHHGLRKEQWNGSHTHLAGVMVAARNRDVGTQRKFPGGLSRHQLQNLGTAGKRPCPDAEVFRYYLGARSASWGLKRCQCSSVLRSQITWCSIVKNSRFVVQRREE